MTWPCSELLRFIYRCQVVICCQGRIGLGKGTDLLDDFRVLAGEEEMSWKSLVMVVEGIDLISQKRMISYINS